MPPTSLYSIKFVKIEATPRLGHERRQLGGQEHIVVTPYTFDLALEVHRTGFLNFRESKLARFHVRLRLKLVSRDGERLVDGEENIWLEARELNFAGGMHPYHNRTVGPTPDTVRRFGIFKRQVGRVQYNNVTTSEMAPLGSVIPTREYYWEAELRGPKWLEDSSCKFASARVKMTAAEHENEKEKES